MGPSSDADLKTMWAISFQNVIKNLMYAMVCIRPNITHAMGVVNWIMANPRQSHWIVVKQIFHHLKSTMDFGLCFKKKSRMLLCVRCILTRMLTIAKAKHISKRM
jgi:hypothetical protein